MVSCKEDLSAFPGSARIRAGHELFMVQMGRDPGLEADARDRRGSVRDTGS
jgi:hypothetical protein